MRIIKSALTLIACVCFVGAISSCVRRGPSPEEAAELKRQNEACEKARTPGRAEGECEEQQYCALDEVSPGKCTPCRRNGTKETTPSRCCSGHVTSSEATTVGICCDPATPHCVVT
jgi:hypothetical protein